MTVDDTIGHYAFTEENLVAVTREGPNLAHLVSLDTWYERNAGKDVLLVSACLGGTSFRYERSKRWDPRVLDLAKRFALVFVCPDSLGRVPGRRQPYEVETSHDGDDVLDGKGKVVTEEGKDVTMLFMLGAIRSLHIARAVGAKTAVFMDGSTACGVRTIGDGSFKGVTKTGRGVTTAYLRKRGIGIVGADGIKDLLDGKRIADDV